MNKRNFGILLAVAGLFVVLAIVGGSGNDSAPIAGDTAGNVFLEGLGAELDDIEQLVIDGPGGVTLVTLDRTEDGWNVANLDGYPADPGLINAALIELGEARIVEEKTADPAFYDRLGVVDIASPDAAGLLVTLVSAGGSQYQAILGDTYSGGQRYARLEGSSRSVLIDRDPELPEAPRNWVMDEILDLAADRIQQVSIAHADGETLVLTKAGRSDVNFTVENIPADRELQYASIGNVTANLVSGLNLDEVERRPVADTEPLAVVEFRTFDGLVLRVTSEAADDDGEPWLSFAASYDSDQAVEYAMPGDDADADADTDANADTSAANDAMAVSTEAEALNGRLSGWRYRIPSFKYSQLTRRMDDLLLALQTE